MFLTSTSALIVLAVLGALVVVQAGWLAVQFYREARTRQAMSHWRAYAPYRQMLAAGRGSR